MIRVLLVDNSPLVLVVLKRTLVPVLEIKVVGTSSNGEKAMELMHFLRPEMICTGLYMPVLDGLSFVKEVLFRYLTLILLVPYSRIPVIKNKKFEECIEIINSNIPPRYLSPSEHGD
jgi:chemotaxis response regulator CheB